MYPHTEHIKSKQIAAKTMVKNGKNNYDRQVMFLSLPAGRPLVPTPSRRPSVSQSAHLGRKASHQSPLSPVLEENDSGHIRHPPLPPPPSFSPALPHQVKQLSTPPASEFYHTYVCL